MSTRIQFLQDQFKQSRNVLSRFLHQVPDEKWFDVAGQPQSNIAWQVGHLVIATYFHGIGLMDGKECQTLDRLSYDIYRKHCVGLGSKERVLPQGLISPAQLRNELLLVQAACDEKLLALTNEMLDLPPEPSRLNHPIAATKYEVLSWMFKHDAWHCGEMELIKLNLGLGFKWQ